MAGSLLQLREKALGALSRIEFLGPLLARLTVGVVFAQSGWGKLNNLPQVIEFFESIGIPAPELQAPFVAGVELVAGALLVVGLASRFAAVPLVITMVVAIATALWDEVGGIGDLLGLLEFAYIAILVWVAISGPGVVSLDALLVRWMGSADPGRNPSLVGVPSRGATP
jgi:putative oxidoreductase